MDPAREDQGRSNRLSVADPQLRRPGGRVIFFRRRPIGPGSLTGSCSMFRLVSLAITAKTFRSIQSSRNTSCPIRRFFCWVKSFARAIRTQNPYLAGEGLRSIAQGFGALSLSDHEILKREFIVYDALYAECKRRTG